MLTRVGADRFSAPSGQQIQIVSRSRNNNGTNDARFEYNGVLLPRETIQGLPGCTFSVVPSTQTFEAIVAFDPGAPPTARYDLFEVDLGGGLIDLQEDAFPIDPLINFGITGEGAAAGAAARPAGRAGATRPAGAAGAARPVGAAATRRAARSRAAKKTKKPRVGKSASTSARRKAGATKRARKGAKKSSRRRGGR